MLTVPVYKICPPPLEAVASYLAISWEAGRLTNRGPLVQLLEHRLSSHFNVDASCVVVVSNATVAIQGAMETFGEVTSPWLVPSWTFPATYLAAHNSHHSYEIVDVDLSGRLPPIINFRPAIEVWPFGMGAVPSSFTLGTAPRIIDAAASFDALEGVGDMLSDGQAIVLSLHATKVLNGTEGGVVITKNKDWIERIRAWANFGFAGAARFSSIIGTNAKMSDADAAVALASLDAWPTTREKWRSLKSDLMNHMASEGLLIPSPISDGWATNYLIMESDDIFSDETLLASLGIETRRWWTPAHLVKDIGLTIARGSTFPNSTKFYESWLGLPMYLSMDIHAWKTKISQFARRRTTHRGN